MSDVADEFAAAKLSNKESAESIKLKLVDLKKAINPAAAQPIDRKKVVPFIQLSRALAHSFAEDVEVPKYLSTSAEFARGIGEIDLAVSLYGQVYQDFPDHSLAPVALFIQGFILENELDQKDKAKINYERFIKQYPNHEFAATAKLSLEQFGMTPEELIKSFQNKNEQ